MQLGAVHAEELNTELDLGTAFAGGSYITILLHDFTYLLWITGGLLDQDHIGFMNDRKVINCSMSYHAARKCEERLKELL